MAVDITSADDFAAAFQDARPVLMSLAVRMVGPDRAADVVSETALKAWKARTSFRGETARPRTWFYRITRNVALDVMRRECASPIGETEFDLTRFTDRRPSPEAEAAFESSRQSLFEHMEAELPAGAAKIVRRWLTGESEKLEARKASAWRYRRIVRSLAPMHFSVGAR